MFLIPGHPGFTLYVNTLDVVRIALDLSATTFFLMMLRRDPREPGRRAITATLIFLTLGCLLGNPSLQEIAVTRLGVSNTAQQLIDCGVGVNFSAALIIALSIWHDPPEKQKKTRRAWLGLACVLNIVPMALWCVRLLPQSAALVFADIYNNHREAYPHLMDMATIFAVFKARSLCNRNTRREQRGWTAQGLRLIRLATTVDLSLIPVFLAMHAANALFGWHLPQLETYGIPCVFVATILIATGLTLPAAGPLWDAARQRREDERAYRELEPLWSDLADDNPDIRLFPHTGEGADYLLYRRVVEIRDGLTRLSPHITAPRPEDGAETGPQAAEQINRALQDKHADNGDNGADRADGFAYLSGDNPHADFEAETRWLRDTARQYARIRNNHRQDLMKASA